MFRRFLLCAQALCAFLAALLVLAAPAAADSGKVIEAHPAMWKVIGPRGTAYLLGSIHILPANVHWKTPEIMAAVKQADVFVFEIPLDHQVDDAKKMLEVQKKIQDEHGLLAPGQSLRGSLPAKLIPEYDQALDALSISPGYVDRLAPWLAAIVFENAQFARSDYDAEQGVDREIYAMATAASKPTQGLETFEDQLAIITPEEQKNGLEALTEEIGEANTMGATAQVDKIVDEWARGDEEAIAKSNLESLSKDPQFQKVLLDNRNARWVPEIEKLLDQERVYFITVGAAHLAGVGGVPARLRAAGYHVEGPGLPLDLRAETAEQPSSPRLAAAAKPVVTGSPRLAAPKPVAKTAAVQQTGSPRLAPKPVTKIAVVQPTGSPRLVAPKPVAKTATVARNTVYPRNDKGGATSSSARRSAATPKVAATTAAASISAPPKR